MKKIQLRFIIFFLLVVSFISEAEEVKPIIMKTFLGGIDEGKLGLDVDGFYAGGDTVNTARTLVSAMNYLYINDNVNRRIVKLDSDLAFVESESFDGYGLIRSWLAPGNVIVGSNILGDSRFDNSAFWSDKTEFLSISSLGHFNIDPNEQYFFVTACQNIFVFQTADGLYFGFNLSQNGSKRNREVLQDNEIMDIFSNIKDGRFSLLSRYILDGNQLMSRAPDTLKSYFSQLKGFEKNNSAYLLNTEMTPLPNGNYLFASTRQVWIVGQQGEVLHNLVFPARSATSNFTASIDGNIYYLHADYNANTTSLLRVGPYSELLLNYNGLSAQLIDSNVNLREEATTKSSVVIKLTKGTPVRILDQTTKPETIDGMTAVWYQVRLWDRTEGWVFGAFLDISNP